MHLLNLAKGHLLLIFFFHHIIKSFPFFFFDILRKLYQILYDKLIIVHACYRERIISSGGKRLFRWPSPLTLIQKNHEFQKKKLQFFVIFFFFFGGRRFRRPHNQAWANEKNPKNQEKTRKKCKISCHDTC